MVDKLVSYCHSTSILPPNEMQDVRRVATQSTKSKILKAFLDIAILKEIDNISALSIPTVIELFVKKYAIYITPGTIYPIFERLEKQGYIVRLPNRLTRLYFVTAEGKKRLEGVQQNVDELQ